MYTILGVDVLSGGIMIKAVIFDFDGLIIDTETPEFQVWQAIYAEYDVYLPFDLWSKCIGSSIEAGFNPYKYLKDNCEQEIDEEALRRNKQTIHSQAIAKQPILPGVIARLDEAKAINLKIGLASSSSAEWVKPHLQSRDLLDYFECVVTCNDVENIKPSPDVYLLATKQLGIKPQETIAIEDSPNGVIAAKNAGLYCIAIPNILTQKLSFNNADIVINSLDKITLQAAINMFT